MASLSVPQSLLRLFALGDVHVRSKDTQRLAVVGSFDHFPAAQEPLPVVLYWSYMRPNGPSEHLLWAHLAVVVGFGMTLRYLKFYRLYAIEVFTAYAYGKDKEPERKP